MQRKRGRGVVSGTTVEATMRACHLATLSAVLLGSAAVTTIATAADQRGDGTIVIAQGSAPSSGPMLPNAAGESQEPNAKPGGGGQASPTRPSASQADQAVPPNASGTHPGSNNTANSMGGAGGQPPGATAQTNPSTRDADNAREDKRIIMEHALELDGAQRQKITQMLANSRGAATTGAAPPPGSDLAVGNTLPASVSMHDFPQAIVEQMPELGKYKYVQLPDRVLVIEPNNRIVITDIKG
jgi:hypothetical protein